MTAPARLARAENRENPSRRARAGEAGGPSLILGVETSCDETSAAVLAGTDEVLGHVILTQDEHRVFGGVVPEIAARAHVRVLDDVVDAALGEAGARLRDVDLFGVTAGPGLIGALLVGVEWTKAAAWALGRPVVGVHHMEAHLFAANLSDPPAEPPFVALLVSGGHTQLLWVPRWGAYRLLGQTRDDAAGEAFDKVARLLGLPFPGGAHIERLATAGDPRAFDFPRPMLEGGTPEARFDFSFSGLKTAVALQVRELEARGALDETARADVAASFQAAAIEVLVEKAIGATRETGCSRLVIGGGVAASGALRRALAAALGADGALHHPPPRLATDNAAMVARTARFRYAADGPSSLDLGADAALPMPGLGAA